MADDTGDRAGRRGFGGRRKSDAKSAVRRQLVGCDDAGCGSHDALDCGAGGQFPARPPRGIGESCRGATGGVTADYCTAMLTVALLLLTEITKGCEPAAYSVD